MGVDLVLAKDADIPTPSCFDKPTIVYPNGSNSTYECWLRQFTPLDIVSPNSVFSDCNAANAGNCFFIGNDRLSSPTLGYDYYLMSSNSQTITIAQVSGRNAVWRRVEMDHDNYGLYYQTDGTCLDAYWDNGVVKVHQHPCGFENRNQWWRYSMHNNIQVFQHAVHTDWCLQTNGFGNNVHMAHCNWGVLEQQRRLYW
ncbi:hypothetical protein H310_02043, partial [Aphanomyces invadans]